MVMVIENTYIVVKYIIIKNGIITLSLIKLKASWATHIDRLALSWGHYIPRSFGCNPASNMQVTKDRLLTKQKPC